MTKLGDAMLQNALKRSGNKTKEPVKSTQQTPTRGSTGFGNSMLEDALKRSGETVVRPDSPVDIRTSNYSEATLEIPANEHGKPLHNHLSVRTGKDAGGRPVTFLDVDMSEDSFKMLQQGAILVLRCTRTVEPDDRFYSCETIEISREHLAAIERGHAIGLRPAKRGA